MKKIKSHGQEALHPAINMNAVQAKLLATVGSASATGAARTTIDIRVNGALVANADAIFVLRNFDNFPREFVSQYARIGVHGMAASEGMEIAAAHPHPPHAHQSLAGLC